MDNEPNFYRFRNCLAALSACWNEATEAQWRVAAEDLAEGEGEARAELITICQEIAARLGGDQ